MNESRNTTKEEAAELHTFVATCVTMTATGCSNSSMCIVQSTQTRDVHGSVHHWGSKTPQFSSFVFKFLYLTMVKALSDVTKVKRKQMKAMTTMPNNLIDRRRRGADHSSASSGRNGSSLSSLAAANFTTADTNDTTASKNLKNKDNKGVPFLLVSGRGFNGNGLTV